MKRKMSVIILMVIVVSLMSGFVYANDEVSTLYKLKLLAGDGTGFNLEGQLKRSDAAAFIVKFIGKNEYIKANGYKYNDTYFADVDKNEWYAPYIGYLVSKGVVEGYEDGTFKPDKSVSEKAFIKMALVGLGYEYNKDFDWNTLYTKAYEVGIVDDINYTVKEDDNLNYNRGSVVNVIYSALDKYIKNENKTVVQRLVDEKVVTLSIVEDLNLIKNDELITTINSISVLSQTNIKVMLNEEVVSCKLEVTDSNGSQLLISEKTINGNEINITTEEQAENEKYTVKLIDVKDSEDFIISLLEKDFTSNDIAVIESQFFEIAKVIALNNREVEVTFTHPVDESAIQALLYSIKQSNVELISGNSQTMSITTNTGNDNSVKIWLNNDALESGKDYIIDISCDLTSKYTVYLNKGEGQSFAFTGTDVEPEKLKLDKIKVLSDDYIRLTFNKPLDNDSALNETNYSMDDLDSSTGDYNQSYDVKFTGSGDLLNRQIDVKFLNMKKGHDYELEIDDLKDIYDYDELDNYEKEFSCDYSNDSDDAVVEFEFAMAENEKMVNLYFTEELSELSENAYITISGETIIRKVLNEEKPYILTLILSSKFTESETEDIRIVSGIYDINENRVETEMKFEDVKGSSKNLSDAKISKADFISEDKIKVEFNRSINTTSSDNKDDYVLEYEDDENDNHKITADKVLFITDKILILTFDTVEDIDEYELIVTDLFDIFSYKTEEINETLNIIK
ncbi:S-layer homology domain-containing protein [Clostridiaceae bacterium HSG29]|nr:S-layer homology domain-containing protein [Clostridiaceae bacterium HSG29]